MKSLTTKREEALSRIETSVWENSKAKRLGTMNEEYWNNNKAKRITTISVKI